MPSITTQNIAAASPQLLPANAQPRAVPTPTAQQLSVLSRQNADSTTVTPVKDDKRRAPQRPPRVEPLYSAQGIPTKEKEFPDSQQPEQQPPALDVEA